MKEILLDKKWIGAAALVVFTLFVAGFFTNFGVKFVTQFAPVVEKEVNSFLPITFSDGEIVAPQDTVISKTYGSQGGAGKVVLNTTVDEFETSELKERGLYMSRKYFYVVSDKKTEIRDYKTIPNMTVDEEVMGEFFKVAKERAGRYIFSTIFIFFLAFAASAIGLYSVAMYLPLKYLYHHGFAYTLRINTFAYIVVSALTMLLGFNLSIIVTFVLLFGANCGVFEGLKQLKENK